jgi:hypothetical protein
MDGDDSRFIAFWELHDVPGTANLETNLCRAAGVPDYINHIAFAVSTADDLARRKDRWLAAGRDVLEIDHGWCTSIYANDPGGTLVEFCCTTRVFTQADVDEAQALVDAAAPPLGATPPVEIYEANPA